MIHLWIFIQLLFFFVHLLSNLILNLIVLFHSFFSLLNLIIFKHMIWHDRITFSWCSIFNVHKHLLINIIFGIIIYFVTAVSFSLSFFRKCALITKLRVLFFIVYVSLWTLKVFYLVHVLVNFIALYDICSFVLDRIQYWTPFLASSC